MIHLFPMDLLASLGDFASFLFIVQHNKAVAGFRNPVNTQHLHRRRGTCRFHPLVPFVQQCTNASPMLANHKNVPDLQGAFLNQNRGNGSFPFVQAGFQYHAAGFFIGIGLQIQHFRFQQNFFQ